MDTDDRLPDDWIEAARGYHRPPETPRDEIWAGIEAGLDREHGVVSLAEARRRRSPGSLRRWLGGAVAAAAVLAVGIGIGRLTAPTEPGPMADAGGDAPGAAAAEVSPAVRVATMEHLGRAESFLSLVRADARSGRVDGDVAEWSRGLLSQTRLLLDSPVAADPALRELLEDLELILAQVAVLDAAPGTGADRTRTELDIIARGMEEHDVLSRIQAVMPAGPEAEMTGI